MLYPNGLTSRPIVSDPYGWRIHPISGVRSFHYGTDSYGHPDGFNHAPEAGVVVYAGYNGGAGNQVSIQGATRLWKLFHHARIDVVVGQRLALGQRTGPTGTTGNSTGIHCHTECWAGSSSQDAFAYIAANLGGFAGGGGGSSIPQQKEGTMTTLYHSTLPSPVPPEFKALYMDKVGQPIYMLVGESPGTPLNAQLTQGPDLANMWAAVHGGARQASIPLSWPQFLAWYKEALAPLAIAADVELGDVAFPKSLELGPTSLAALAKVEAAVNRLNPPG